MPKKKTNDDFIKEIEILVGKEYEIKTEYKNAHTDVLIKHCSDFCDNYEFPMRPYAFLNGQRCPKCALEIKRQKRAFTNDEFQNRLFQTFNGEFTTNNDYINQYSIMTFIHTKCGREFNTTSKSLFKNGNCHHCKKEELILKRTKTHEQFIQEVFDLVGNEYTVLNHYEKSGIYIKIKHNICNHEYSVTPENFLYGYRCSKCNSLSKGEKTIFKYLDSNDIKYISQYKFEGCRDKSVLPFDFAVFNNEDKLMLLIEYDGQQHFKAVQFGGIPQERAVENFKITQLHDQIKNTYCRENSIPLLRIPYNKLNNIIQILDSYIHNN